MSNILTPIVERYSLFFTLAMCSSSSISRSKQPTHLVQTLLLEAQQRYQDKYTEKLRALTRHLSTTSTSSSSLSQSVPSQLTSSSASASAGSDSTEISSPSSYIQPALPVPASSSFSTCTSRIEPPSSHLDLMEGMPSLPPASKQEWQEGSFPAAAHNKNNNQSSELRIKDKDKDNKATPLPVSTLDRIEQEKETHHSNNHSRSNNHSCRSSNNNHNERGGRSSPPCSPPLIGDGNDDTIVVYALASTAVTTASANAATTVSSDRPDQQLQQTSTHPSPSSSYSLSVPVSFSVSFSSPSSPSIAAAHAKQQQQQQRSNNNNNKASKVNKSSIAALLSVTLTMILLSLLQSKKRHFRRKGRSLRGTTSKNHSRRGSRHLLGPHREGYKSTGTDQVTHRSHSPSSSASHTNTNTYNTYTSNNSVSFLTIDNTSHYNINMEGTSPVPFEGARSSSQLLTQYGRPASFFGGGHGGEPTSAAYHINNHHHLSSLPPSTHGLPENMLPSSPSSNPSYPPSTFQFDPTTRLSLHQGNMYSGRDIGYSLSDTNLPDKRSKRDLVADWLDQQTFVSPSDMVDSSPENILPLVQDGPNNSYLADDKEPLHQLHHHITQTHHFQQQQQQQHQRQSFPAQLEPHQIYHQHSINNTGAQREPRQQQQLEQQHHHHQYPRAIQRTNELYPGSRSSLYRSSSVSRHSMVALDQQQQQQQQSSFWRESQSQLQSQQQQQQQFSPHQHRPQYPHYPQQQHPPHPHPHPQHAHYGQYQQQYHQPGLASPSAYRASYEPLGYEDLHQHDANHSRSLSLNRSGGRRGGGTGSRPQSQVYRKATPARFENLSLAEQARQEHQMRRQHYQQHFHQHRQQQQQHQQFQHQQYYQAPGSRPESMYSNGYPAATAAATVAAATSPRQHPMGSTSPREGTQFVPPRHPHQAHHPRPQLPSIVTHQQQHRHSVVSVSSPKSSSISRSANDLAWERHSYYQQQQMQEEALAERKRIEQQQQQQQKKMQRPLSSVEGGLQVPLFQDQSSSVVRTSSMSRISSISTAAVTGGNTASNVGRRTAVGKVALGSTSSSGLSRSVSTSAIAGAKMRANAAAYAIASNKKDKSSHPHLKKKNSKELATAETETKSSGIDCKFLRLFRSDSKLLARKTVSGNNTESQQAQPVGNGGASSKEQSTIPVIVTIQPIDSTTTPPTPTTTTPATGLHRRRTLKDLAPSIRSLARRCSSRFSSSSTRPSSFAGSSSDPVIPFPEGGKSIGGSNSLSMTTSYLPLKLSLSSLPRSLAPGPDGIVDLQQAASQPATPLSVKYFPPASACTPSFPVSDVPPTLQRQQQEQEQRVPIHRKVTLFRSKTLSMYKSSPRATSPPPPFNTDDNTIDTTPSNGMAASDDHDDDYNNNSKTPSTRANSLQSRRRRQRDSLRLANGHGLDFDTFLPPTTASNVTASTSADEEASAAAVERSTNDLECALPGAGLGQSTGPPVLPAIVTTGGRLSNFDQQQKARRQIISLLAMGRKDRISAKTGHVMKSGSSTSSSPSTPTTASTNTIASTPTTPLSQLSPLALEAQEDLFVSPGAGVEKMKVKGEDEDPCEKIAFMLVPKSRYEFQPLVVA